MKKVNRLGSFFLWSVILIAFTGLQSCGPDNHGKGWRWLPNMVYPLAYEAYSDNPNTPSGVTMMPPVPGTVHREQFLYPYSGDDEGLELAMSKPLPNPVPNNDKTFKRGQVLFERTCRTCHGSMADGNGPIVTNGETDYPPVSLVLEHVRDYSDGYIFHYISFGGNAVMPGYAAQIRPEDRWKIIHYLRKLQQDEVNENPDV